MSTLTIKDVPVDWAQALRSRASRNHRSLQGELMALLEQAVRESTSAQGGSVQGVQAWGAGERTQAEPGLTVAPRGWKSIEQVSSDLLSKYPQRIGSGPSSTELIRQERDAR